MIIVILQTAISFKLELVSLSIYSCSSFNTLILDFILLSYIQYMSLQNLIGIFFDAFCD